MALQLTGLTITYDRTVAVDQVSLEVPDGQILALLGPSGCGKSTLLRAIAGLEPLQEGRVSWDGVDLARVPLHRRGFGLMFQDGVLFPHQTVAANIGYGLRVGKRDLTKPEQQQRVSELLYLVGLAGYGNRSVGELSGGEAQRVALARALAPRPRLLLLDEPLAALDKSLRENLLLDLRRILTATRTTTVFVTHDQNEAFGIADRVALMDAGRIRQHGVPRDVWDHPIDEWVARFVGYTTVLDAGLVDRARPDGDRIAFRPSALRLDPSGDIEATVLAASASPDHTALKVLITGWGEMEAVAPADSPVAVGESITLRHDAAGVARLRSASWPAKS